MSLPKLLTSLRASQSNPMLWGSAQSVGLLKCFGVSNLEGITGFTLLITQRGGTLSLWSHRDSLQSVQEIIAMDGGPVSPSSWKPIMKLLGLEDQLVVSVKLAVQADSFPRLEVVYEPHSEGSWLDLPQLFKVV